MFSFKERITEVLFEATSALMISMVGAVVDLFMELLLLMTNLMLNPTSFPLVNTYIMYAQIIATTLLGVKVAYDALTIYILRSSGEPNVDGGGMLGRAALSVVIIYLIPFIVGYLFQVGFSLAGGVIAVGGEVRDDVIVQSWYNNIVTEMAGIVSEYIWGLMALAIVLLIGVILAMVVMIQMMVRSAELVLMAIIGPFAAVGLQSELFSAWWKKILSLMLGFAIQILMFRLSFYMVELMVQGSGDDRLGMFFLIGFLWATIKSPRVLEGLIESTGLGRVAGSAGQMVMMRKILTGGRG